MVEYVPTMKMPTSVNVRKATAAIIVNITERYAIGILVNMGVLALVIQVDTMVTHVYALQEQLEITARKILEMNALIAHVKMVLSVLTALEISIVTAQPSLEAKIVKFTTKLPLEESIVQKDDMKLSILPRNKESVFKTIVKQRRETTAVMKNVTLMYVIMMEVIVD